MQPHHDCANQNDHQQQIRLFPKCISNQIHHNAGPCKTLSPILCGGAIGNIKCCITQNILSGKQRSKNPFASPHSQITGDPDDAEKSDFQALRFFPDPALRSLC